MLCESIVIGSRYMSYLKYEGNLENIFLISPLLQKDFCGYKHPVKEDEIKTMCLVKGLISITEVLVYTSMRQICGDLDYEYSFDWLVHFSDCMDQYSDSILRTKMKLIVELSRIA